MKVICFYGNGYSATLSEYDSNITPFNGDSGLLSLTVQSFSSSVKPSELSSCNNLRTVRIHPPQLDLSFLSSLQHLSELYLVAESCSNLYVLGCSSLQSFKISTNQTRKLAVLS
ncbi:hypothetical protein RCL1_004600 [Eukaryota sp. TZLM3-RCL]